MAVQTLAGQRIGGQVGFAAVHVISNDTYCHSLKARRHALKVSGLMYLNRKHDSDACRSKEDSEQISGLREEIHVLKNLIIENHNDLTELQRAEQCAEAELHRHPSPGAATHQATQLSNIQRDLSPGRIEPDGHGTLFQNSLSSHSDTGDEESISDIMANSTGRTRTQSPGKYELEQTQLNIHVADTTVDSAVQPLSAYNSTAGSGSHRASKFLLQMVPYRSRDFRKSFNRPDLLTDGGPAENARPYAEPKPVMEEATNSVRLLLDKWTTLGSAPVSDVLAEGISNNLPEG